VAAQRGNVQLVKVLLANGADVDIKDRNGRAPIHSAAWEGHWGPVQVFIGAGADVNAADKGMYTPLHIAAERGHDRMVRLLLSRGADANARNYEGNTPLALAEKDEKESVIELLKPVTVGAFELALRSGDFAEVERLIKDNPKLVSQRIEGSTPLHLAARAGNEKIAELLLAHGASFLATDESESRLTPLHEAAKQGYADIADLLITMGANPNAMDAQGRTPLRWAMARGHESVVLLLREKGAKGDARDALVTDPAVIAGARSREDARSVLIGLLGNALSTAILQGNKDKVEQIVAKYPLLANGIMVGGSPLRMACGSGHTEIVKVLLANGADIHSEKPAPGGGTLLHESAAKGQVDIMKQLLVKGADVYAKDDEGRTPLDVAQAANQAEIVTLLKAYMGIQ
jgi:ankyrin repeat protein